MVIWGIVIMQNGSFIFRIVYHPKWSRLTSEGALLKSFFLNAL
jgi:hypothetical protein